MCENIYGYNSFCDFECDDNNDIKNDIYGDSENVFDVMKDDVVKLGSSVVRETMTFSTYHDFYNRCGLIRNEYYALDTKDKIIYKMYVYSHCLLSDTVRDKIWEWLNEPLTSMYHVSKHTLRAYLRRVK